MIDSPLVQFLLRHKLALLLVCVVAARLIGLLLVPGAAAWDGAVPAQGAALDTSAQTLLATGRFDPAAPSVSPVYSVALAGVYGWFGRGAVSVALWHTALAVLAAYAFYELGRRLFRGWGPGQAEAAGWFAGLVFALSPTLIVQTYALTDSLLVLTLLGLGLMLAATLRDRRKVNARTIMLGVMGGVVLGLGALLRPAMLPLLTLIIVWFLFRWPLSQTLLRVTPLVLVALVIVALWPEGSGGSPSDLFVQPLHGVLIGTLAILSVIGVAVTTRLWRDVSLLWFLPLLVATQLLIRPSAAFDPTLALPALFLFAGAALVWLAVGARARRSDQVTDDSR